MLLNYGDERNLFVSQQWYEIILLILVTVSY